MLDSDVANLYNYKTKALNLAVKRNKVSVNIMKAFIEMRKFLSQNGQMFERLTTLEYKQLENIK